ncbi:MAG: glycosyltransferase [Prevotella sp.]|jgi:glycosyltransferase involved in cell wall biosynthesis|nr:glycosyltransferase [Prevotella sp.]
MEPTISVVMTVYDNARELEENLPAYLSQDYAAGYELIVVDESSTDDTDDVLTRFKSTLSEEGPSRLYTTFLPRPNRLVSRQRMALTLGVKAAKNEWIVFSNIHNVPSPTWLKEIAEFAKGSTELIIGYVGKNGDIRLQLFNEISSAGSIIGKAERQRANGHKGKFMRHLRGKYDFMAVPTRLGHDVLRLYELPIRGSQLFRYRVQTILYNMVH